MVDAEEQKFQVHTNSMGFTKELVLLDCILVASRQTEKAETNMCFCETFVV